MNTFSFRIFTLFFALLVLSVYLAACGGDEEEVTPVDADVAADVDVVEDSTSEDSGPVEPDAEGSTQEGSTEEGSAPTEEGSSPTEGSATEGSASEGSGAGA